MSGVGGFALATAPIAGGALLAMSFGGMGKAKLKTPDARAVIVEELELLKRIPQDQIARREALQRTIQQQIDDLIVATEKSRILRRRIGYIAEEANWRDLLLFICAVLFAMLVWNLERHTWHWLPLFIAMILLCFVTAAIALHGYIKSLRASMAAIKTPADQPPPPVSGAPRSV